MDKSESEYLDTVHNIQSSNCETNRGESTGDGIYENCNIESDTKPSIEAVYFKEEPCSYEFTEVNDDQCSEHSVSVEVKNEPCIDYDDLDSNIKKHDNLHQVNDDQCCENSVSVEVKNEPCIDYDDLDSNIKKHEDDVGPKSCSNLTTSTQNDDSGTHNVVGVTKQADHCKGNVATFNCTECPKRFVNLSSLKRHLFIHRSSKYQCSQCRKRFANVSGLARHSLTHIDAKLFKCGQCGKRYTDASNLKRHTLIHNDDNPFKCTLCSEGFINSALLQKHVLTHRDVSTAPTQNDSPERDSMSYRDVSTAPTQNDLPERDSTSYRDVSTAPTQNDSPERDSTSCSGSVSGSTSKLVTKWHKCDFCEKSYSRVTNLSRHSLIHSDSNPYKCSQCNKGFSTSALLQKHILTHISKTHPLIDLQEIESAVCSGFVERNSILFHSDAKYRCSHCGKYWPDAKSRRRHAKTHSFIKRYKCNDCDRSYTDLSNLKRHSSIHSESNPYKCTQCNKGFSNSALLQKHLLTHNSAIQPLPCAVKPRLGI